MTFTKRLGARIWEEDCYLCGEAPNGVVSWVAFKVYLLAFFAKVGLNSLLIPKYGIIGAGAASIVSYTIVWSYIKLTGLSHASWS